MKCPSWSIMVPSQYVCLYLCMYLCMYVCIYAGRSEWKQAVRRRPWTQPVSSSWGRGALPDWGYLHLYLEVLRLMPPRLFFLCFLIEFLTSCVPLICNSSSTDAAMQDLQSQIIHHLKQSVRVRIIAVIFSSANGSTNSSGGIHDLDKFARNHHR